jgi:hypothetical protein
MKALRPLYSVNYRRLLKIVGLALEVVIRFMDHPMIAHLEELSDCHIVILRNAYIICHHERVSFEYEEWRLLGCYAVWLL